MSGTDEVLPMPPASGQVIEIFPRPEGDGGLGSVAGSGVGSVVGAGVGPGPDDSAGPAGSVPGGGPEPSAAPARAFPDTPDGLVSRFELRYLERQGLVPPQGSVAQPQAAPVTQAPAGPPADPAGYDAARSPTEPRRGSLRMAPSGGPQTRQDGPAFEQGPPAPEVQGPPAPSLPVGVNALGMIANTFAAATQGYSEAGLEGAQVVQDAELQRRLEPAWNDEGPAADRLRAARERAQEMGIDIAFRVQPDGRVQAVQVTPEMQIPGGRMGRLADALGRVFGLAFVDPVGGALAVGSRGASGGARGVASSGGAGPGARIATGEARYVTSEGKPFVALTDGSIDLARIPDDAAVGAGIAAAPIRLPRGWQDTNAGPSGRGNGELHIEFRHGAQLREKGYSDVAEFVRLVVERMTEIRRDPNGKLFLIARDYAAAGRSHQQDTLIVELVPSASSEAYEVATAGPFMNRYIEKRELLWERERGALTRPAGQAVPSSTPPQEVSGSAGPSSVQAQSAANMPSSGARIKDIADE